MITETSLAPVEILIELHRLGVRVAAKDNTLSFRPASRAPPPLLEEVRASKAEILALLATPRRRWILQAEATIKKINDQDLRQDLRDVFDEREAIASIDGSLDDDAAGLLAYTSLGHRLTASG